MQFLHDDWPLLNATCKFWECRFGRVDSAKGPPSPGYAKGCAAKDGSGNWTVLNVVSPDESAGRPGTVNNSVYTNGAAAQALASHSQQSDSHVRCPAQSVGVKFNIPVLDWFATHDAKYSGQSLSTICFPCVVS